MKSREHVTTNGRAVFFAAMWEDLRNAAKSHGWALALHGSLSSDMDIMAMPWDEHASPVDVMINQICICFTEAGQIEKEIKISKDKPNNRTVYTLPIWADFYLDINVISLPTPPSSPTATAEKDQMEASILKETEEMTMIEWSDPKLGFGRLDLVYKGDGTYTIDAEAMSVKTIIRILKAIGK